MFVLVGEDIKLKREQEMALRAAKAAAAAGGGSEYGDSDYGGNSPRSPLSPSKMNIGFSPENKVVGGPDRKKRENKTATKK